MKQDIQYCIAPDGVRLAYSIIGKGSTIVRTPHWFAHLEHDLESPVFRHMLLGRAHQHSLLRYDARGIGLSQRDNMEISFDKWVSDLETIVDCAKLDRFILFGLSQGAAQAIAYAAHHPDRLTHLILYGGFTRGLLHRENGEKQKEALELACSHVRGEAKERRLLRILSVLAYGGGGGQRKTPPGLFPPAISPGPQKGPGAPPKTSAGSRPPPWGGRFFGGRP